jgi:hypothetical protein
MKRNAIWLAVTAVVLLTAAPASAAQWTVDNDRVQCPTAQFTSIQAAVTAAAPGDTIRVCPGTYNEEVDIDKAGLKLWSTSKHQAMIKAPPTIAASPDKAIVRTGANDVWLERFTISGPGPGPCDTLRFGVYVSNGSAHVKDNHVTEIRDTPFSGCQNGVAVLAGRASMNQVGDVELVDNVIDKYQKGGVVIDNTGSSGLIQQNRVQGAGPTPVTAQNGIQVSRGADADLLQNIVLDNTYTLAPAFGATGMLLFEAGAGVLVKQNYGARNDDNVGTYTTAGAVIEQNDLVASTFFDGIYMFSDTSGNVIRDNFLRNNAEHDCHDDTVDANTWERNDGETQNRPGLCAPRGGDKPGRQEEPNRRNLVSPFLP